jgi:hypothetical protein
MIHFTVTFTLLKLKAPIGFGEHLPILRRHYTNTVLVGVACCFRYRLFTGVLASFLRQPLPWVATRNRRIITNSKTGARTYEPRAPLAALNWWFCINVL